MIRQEDTAGTEPPKAVDNAEPRYADAATWLPRVQRAWWMILIGMMVVFSAFPIANHFLGLSTKDYRLWYQVGLAVREGLDVYPRPETRRLFPFMYPPSAAAMLGFVSLLGPTGSLMALVLVNSASWLACIALADWLAVKPGGTRHPLVVILPSLSVIVLIYNVYLLGQPNLLLLAILLGAFACLRLRRHLEAGALVATAAAIKAFPILVLGYLIYRRMWAASAATVAVLVAWLLIAPLPFRTPAQAIDDLVVWSKGMVFTYDSYSIAQRPLRSYSYKNQSIMALAHRLLREVPADGESVLARKMRAEHPGARSLTQLPTVDPTHNLLNFLKPRTAADGLAKRTNISTAGTRGMRASSGAADVQIGATLIAGADPSTADQPGRWDDLLPAAQADFLKAWRVNLVNLNFRTVTAITGALILALCLFVAAVLPAANRRTRETDAMEFALVTLLTVMFSPLSFNYAYVWMIYPMTLALHLVIREPARTPQHSLHVTWIVVVLLIPALAIPMPQMAQAYGNLFVPALLLVLGLGAMLYTAGRLPSQIDPSPAPSPSRSGHSSLEPLSLVDRFIDSAATPKGNSPQVLGPRR